MLSIESAVAVGCYSIDGQVKDSVSGALLSGVHVRNETNITGALSFDTTGADGFFNLSCYYTDPNTTLWFNASGYTEQAVKVIISAGGHVTYSSSGLITNGSSATQLVPVTPVNGAVTVSSITKNSAIIAWTVNTPTDNVSNNYVDQQLIISASGVPNITQAWTNSTLVNSYTLSNLNANQKYTYYAIAYNTANNAITDQDSTTFTTLRGGTASYWTPEPTPTIAKKTVLEKITGKKTSNNNIIIGAAAVIIIIIIGFYFYNQKGK